MCKPKCRERLRENARRPSWRASWSQGWKGARSLTSVPAGQRLLVGISGVPGAGKSTLAQQLADALNAQGHAVATVVGMDGWHYSRAQLDAFPDPAHAHARRGAAFTFDADAFVAFATALRASEPNLLAPAFSHAEKDPVADVIKIADARIVIVEGLYCNLSIEPWRRAADLWDVRWLITTTDDIARERLISRHVASGIARSPEEARERGASSLTAENNDLPNGAWILANTLEPTERIELTG